MAPLAPSRTRALITGLAATVAVAYGAAFYAYSVLITKEAAGAVFSTTVLSWAFGGAVLTGGAAAVPVGRVADRHGIRGVIALGSVLGCAGLVGFAMSQHAWQVLLSWWVILGPATAMTFYEPTYVAIDQWVPEDRRPRAIASLTLLAGLSGPVFIPATSALVSAFGWRTTAALLGAGLAAVGVLVALLLIPKGAPQGRPPPERSGGRRAVAPDPRFVVFTAAAFFAYGAFEAVVVHRVARFEDAGFAVSSISLWAAFSGILSFPGRFLLPSLAERVRPTTVLAGVLAAMAGASAFAIRATRLWEVVAHFCLFGLVLGAALPLRAVVMTSWYSGEGFGAIMGVQAAAIAVARASGPALTGVLKDRAGYGVAMLILTSALGVAVVLTLTSERTARD